MKLEESNKTAGEIKIEELTGRVKDRIKNGEEYKDVLLDVTQGLPETWVNKIKENLNPIPKASISDIPRQYQGMKSEALQEMWADPSNIQIKAGESDEERLKEINRRKMIVEELRRLENKFEPKSEDSSNQKEAPVPPSSLEIEQSKDNLETLVAEITKGKSQLFIDSFNSLLHNVSDPESKKSLISALFTGVYNSYRKAEYPIDMNEEAVWEKYLKNTKVPVNNKKQEWMYRGIFPNNGQETVTRGSFNVHVTSELIDSLDQMIIDGKIQANYKFGGPDTSASPSERHDSITIYFLEEPTKEAITELSQIVKPYVRGDHLLGKKISEGFFMSEIGSIETNHIDSFVEKVKNLDQELASAINTYTSPVPGRDPSLKMSEAQFYAIKDVAKAFGYNMTYSDKKGFDIVKQ